MPDFFSNIVQETHLHALIHSILQESELEVERKARLEAEKQVTKFIYFMYFSFVNNCMEILFTALIIFFTKYLEKKYLWNIHTHTNVKH